MYIDNSIMNVYNSTITANSGAAAQAGGLQLQKPSVTHLYSTIIAGNTVGLDAEVKVDALVTAELHNCWYESGNSTGITDVTDNNVDDADTSTLSALADNGGFTKTHALQAGSPALNVGSNTQSLTYDQRGTGYDRESGVADIGAFEYVAGATTYSVTYNGNTSNGGSVPVDGSSPYTESDTVTVLGNTFTKIGHTFSHWDTQDDDNGTNYAPAAEFAMGTANVILYAQWTINQYTVTFANGTNGTVGSTTATVNHGETVSAPTVTPNTGWTFDVWDKPLTNITEPQTITATYAQNEYTLLVNNGTGDGTTYNYNQVVDISATITTGYHFDNWTGDTVADANSATTTITMPASNAEVTANLSNDAPVIGITSFSSIDEEGSLTSVNLLITDTDTILGNLTITATAQTADKVESVSVANGLLSLSGVSDANGSVDILIEVTDEGGKKSEKTLSLTINPINDAPVNTAIPVVSGTLMEGQELSSSTGSWNDTKDSGSVSVFAYQWYKADNSGGTVNKTTLGAASTYTLLSSDVGKYISVEVTGTDAGTPTPVKSTTASSAWTGPVSVLSKSLAILGAITEMSEDGATITATLTNATFVGANPTATITGLPTGVSVDTIVRQGDTSDALITLTGNRTTNYDTNITNLEISFASTEHSHTATLSANTGVTFTAIVEMNLSSVGVDVANGNITNTTAAMQYKISSGSWTDCTDTNTSVTFAENDTISVREKAHTYNERLDFATILKNTMPSYAIDYVNEQTKTAVPSTDSYSVNSNMSSSSVGEGLKNSVTPGTNLYFQTTATATHLESSILTLTVASRASAPSISVDNDNSTAAKFVSATTAMEYKLEAGSWTAITDTAMTLNLLGDKTLLVRTKAVADTSFASESTADLDSGSNATPPTLTSDTSANTVDNALNITFTEDAYWRSQITEVKWGTSVIATTNASGTLTIASGVVTTAATKDITIIATGYSDAVVSQTVLSGVIVAGNSTVSISPSLALNTASVITVTAKDQYSNLIENHIAFVEVTITANDATTTESYTGTNTSADLSPTNSSGVATCSVTLPASIDNNDGISLQIKTANTGDNIGSAFSYIQGVAGIAISAATAINELSENGKTITVTLSNATYASSLAKTDWILLNTPSGISIDSISRESDTEAIITLLGNRTVDYDGDITNIGVKLLASQHTGTADTQIETGVTFIATNDTETIATTDTVTEGTEDGKTITVTISGGTFKDTLDKNDWSLSNAPASVIIGSVVKATATTATLTLSGTPADYDVDQTATISFLTTQYDDSTGDSSLSANVDFIAVVDYNVTFNLDGKATRDAGGALVQNNILSGNDATPPTLKDITTGYHFDSWSGTYTGITSDRTITALYAINTYTVTFDLGANGTTSGNTTPSVTHGATVTAPTVTANTGWTFSLWDKPLTNITEAQTITAQYTQNEYTLIVEGGTDTTNTAPYNYNEEVNILATIPAGNHFVNWTTASGGTIGLATSASTTYTMPAVNATVTANFENDAPTITTIPNQTTMINTATSAIEFTIGDTETATSSFTPVGTSDNQTLIPNGNIVFGGSNADRTVTITPATDQTGTAIITISITDTGVGGVTTTETFDVIVTDKTIQTITFNALADKTYGDATFELAATSDSASGIDVVYASSNTTVATVSGTTVTIEGAGTTTITASQAGDDTYAVATDIQQSLKVNKASLTITADNKIRGPSETNPTWTSTYTGLVNSDDESVLAVSYSCSAADNSTTAGTFAIIPSGSTSLANYDVSYVNGKLTILTLSDWTLTSVLTQVTIGGGTPYTVSINGSGVVATDNKVNVTITDIGTDTTIEAKDSAVPSRNATKVIKVTESTTAPDASF